MVDSVSRPSSGGGVGLSRIVASDLVLFSPRHSFSYILSMLYDIFLDIEFEHVLLLPKEIGTFSSGLILNLHHRHEYMECIIRVYFNLIIFNI